METELIEKVLLASGASLGFLNFLSYLGTVLRAAGGQEHLPLAYEKYMAEMTPSPDTLTVYINKLFAPLMYPGYVLGNLTGRLYHMARETR